MAAQDGVVELLGALVGLLGVVDVAGGRRDEEPLDEGLVDQGVLVALLVGEHLVVLLHRRVHVQVPAERDREADARLGVAGLLLEHLLEGLASQRVVRRGDRDEPQVHVGFDVVRIQLQRLLERDDRGAFLALLEEGEGDVVVDVGVLVVQLQGVARGHLGHLVVAAAEVDPRQGLVGLGVLRVLVEEVLDRLDGVVVPPGLRERPGVVVDHVPVLGVGLQVLLVDGQGVDRLAGGLHHVGEVLHRRLEARVHPQAGLVVADGFPALAQLAGCDAGVEAGLAVWLAGVRALLAGERELGERGVERLLARALSEDRQALLVGDLGVDLFFLLAAVLRAGRAAGVAREGPAKGQDQGNDRSAVRRCGGVHGVSSCGSLTAQNRQGCRGCCCSSAPAPARRSPGTPRGAAS